MMLLMKLNLLVISISITFDTIVGNVDKVLNTCESLRNCTSISMSEMDRWNCLSMSLFELSSPRLESEKYVHHDCGGVGWGNNIRGFYNSAAIALVLNRKLKLTFDVYHRMFHFPYSLSSPLPTQQHVVKNYFDYEKHGRPPNRFKNWIDGLNLNQSDSIYPGNNLVAGICGADRDTIVSNECIKDTLPSFYKCATSSNSYTFLDDILLLVPFFYHLFSQPSQLMIDKLTMIRERLLLPLHANINLESIIHYDSLGLRTPGYYIFAMHFRNAPLGFEPLSVMLNENGMNEMRKSLLENFWQMGEKNIIIAANVAKCRNLKLLIYFATDDVHHLRPEAIKRFSKYGQVVGGLTEDEVGHVSPNWTNEPLDTSSNIRNKDRDEDAIRLHGDMSMVEWWILANSNWLMSHAGTSYSDTPGGWGLGPLGVMERLDVVHYGNDFQLTSRRRDWEKDACVVVHSADPTFSDSCPTP
eukprot:gene4121-5875_t